MRELHSDCSAAFDDNFLIHFFNGSLSWRRIVILHEPKFVLELNMQDLSKFLESISEITLANPAIERSNVDLAFFINLVVATIPTVGAIATVAFVLLRHVPGSRLISVARRILGGISIFWLWKISGRLSLGMSKVLLGYSLLLVMAGLLRLDSVVVSVLECFHLYLVSY